MSTDKTEQALPPLEREIDEYIDGYTLEGDDSYYTPNDTERLIAKDVVMGLLAEPWFVAALTAAPPAQPQSDHRTVWDRPCYKCRMTTCDGSCAAPPAQPWRETTEDEVICPKCTHQFRAIPPNVQRLMLDAGFEPPFMAPPAQPQSEPPAPFLFVAMDDDKRAHLTWCADEAAVRDAVKGAMFFLQDGEELSPEHAEQLDGSVDELLDSGALVFEGDAPLYLYRVGSAAQPPERAAQQEGGAGNA